MTMDWKFKKDAEPQGSSDGFWYDLAYGGYIDLEAVLKDKKQIKAVRDAVELLMSLQESMQENELLNEF